MSKKSVTTKNEGLIGTISSFFLRKVRAIGAFLFAFYYPKFVAAYYNEKAFPFRKEVFATSDMVIPSDTQTGQIKILEIGIGPGFNLEFYPKQCRLIALDKNAHFKKVLLTNLRKHPGIILENFIDECGENMRSVASNSIDVVITSHLHCSVDSSQKVLKEIKRVLVPGGRYYFFEHVLDESTTIRYKWQMFLNKIGLWRVIGHGCTFVNFEEEMAKSNFFKWNGKSYVCANTSWTYYLVYLVASNFCGHAIMSK